MRREQTRARYPDAEGYLKRDGVRVFYEVYGTGEPAILLLPTWEIVHSRAWKIQIPYLARHGRVVTFDRRGNGRSDRPGEWARTTGGRVADDARAVLDARGREPGGRRLAGAARGRTCSWRPSTRTGSAAWC